MKKYLNGKASPIVLLVDAHELSLSRTRDLLISSYPDSKIITAQSIEDILNKFPKLKIDLIVMDILLPNSPGETPQTATGINFLTHLLGNYPKLNIVIHSEQIRSLVPMKQKIYSHIGGFTVVNKTLASEEIITRVNWALEQLTYVKDIKDIKVIDSELELKPEWLKLVNLAFREGFKDKVIAKHMCVSERMVRHYWDRVQEALNIDCEELKNQGKNLRVITQIRAREAGLID
ncbi:response regulator [Mastigocoleus testarum]|uniref:Regulator n=1 Tax=Mastigocoleus testarum BC008 TaxID=371196 RepID=A0A0V7ZHV0_9CYAN|nr:response regulator [Mastigocoleus testarum]KST62291.1 regulator [Mastigocoleus testarum BC008]KST64112.1 regulator [Mastigocoleus testarum BC008]